MTDRTGPLEIDWIGGACPVQAEGRIGEAPFYFKARERYWGVGIGAEPCLSPDWYYEEACPEAGIVDEAEARGHIHRAVSLWRRGHAGDHAHWSDHNRRDTRAMLQRVAADLRESDPSDPLLARIEARLSAI